MKGQTNMENTEIVKRLIENHNDSIDAYINITLPRKLRSEGYEVVDDKISLEAWFAAQRIIAEANFYEKASALRSALRVLGYDVKRNATSDKLIWNGDYIDERF